MVTLLVRSMRRRTRRLGLAALAILAASAAYGLLLSAASTATVRVNEGLAGH